jgi:hypothetical protein
MAAQPVCIAKRVLNQRHPSVLKDVLGKFVHGKVHRKPFVQALMMIAHAIYSPQAQLLTYPFACHVMVTELEIVCF